MILDDFLNNILPIKDKLYRFALRIVSDTFEAEDIVQDVFLKVLDRREQWGQVQNPEAWCMTLTKNLSIDRLRSKHRRTEDISTQYQVKSPSASPQHVAEINDMYGKMQHIIEKLPAKQKMVLQLREVEGMAYDEISKVLELPVEHVKTHLFRARQSIRNQLIKVESYGIK